MSYVALGARGQSRALGEYSKTYPDGKVFTVSYYSNPNLLAFSDRNLENFYKGLRDADIDFQKFARDAAGLLRPIAPLIQQVSGGNIKAADVLNVFNNIKLPTAYAALILEMVGGKRPFDASFKANMLLAAQDVQLLSSTLNLVSGVSLLLTGSGWTIPGAQVLLPVVQPLAMVATPAALLAGILVPILKTLGNEEVPTRAKFKEMMTVAAVASGKPAPSEQSINTAYQEMLSARDAAKAEANRAKAASLAAKDFTEGKFVRLAGAPQTVYRVMGPPDKDSKVPLLYLFGPKEGANKEDRLSVWAGDSPKYSNFFPYSFYSFYRPGDRVFIEGSPEETFKVHRIANSSTKQVTIRNEKTQATTQVPPEKLRPAKSTTPEWVLHREQVRLDKEASEARKQALKQSAKDAAKAAAKQAMQEAAAKDIPTIELLKARLAEEQAAKAALVAVSQQQEQGSSDKKAEAASSKTMLYVLGGLAVVGAIALSRSKK